MSAAALHTAAPDGAGSVAPRRPWQPLVLDRAFDLQLRFNLYPATYAHASWIARITRDTPRSDSLTQPCDSPYWLRRLSLALLQARQLEQDFDFIFFDRTKKIALLDAAVLEHIATLMAGLLVRDQIKHIVLGADMMAIEQTLGREAHRFVLGWTAPLPTLGFTLQPPGQALSDSERWSRRAVGLVCALLPDAATATLARMQLKFPYDWARLKRPVLRDEDRASLTELFIAILEQAEPEHAWLFAAPAGPSTDRAPGSPAS
jgi:type III secretion protein K